jgi:hypothetical protein
MAPGKSRRVILALELPYAQALQLSPSITTSSSFFTTAADAAVEVLNYLNHMKTNSYITKLLLDHS